jgi:cytochrome c peroxidase
LKKSNLLVALAIATAVTAQSAQSAPGIPPDYGFRVHSDAKVELGKNLFFDKILSGNKNIACATCHHSHTETGDGLSLPIGEGGRGLGVARNVGSGADLVPGRLPRNVPALFNLDSTHFNLMFHDGRLVADSSEPSGFKNPAGANLPTGLDSALAAQAMFPVQDTTEMAGQAGENSIADAAAANNLAGAGGVWEQLTNRLQANPAYVDLFVDAYDDVDFASDITYVHVANAIAAFEGQMGLANNSPYDQFLAGNRGAMSRNQKKGMGLFFNGDRNGQNCASCHSGLFQTSHGFNAIAMPQIGGGRGNGFDGHDDFGREQVTGDPADRFKFRASTLRNIALTAPYGHDGAFNSLRAIVEHHMDTVTSLYNYDRSQAVLPAHPTKSADDFIVMDDPVRVAAIAAANELPPYTFTPKQVDRILDFLNALTDTGSIDLRAHTPASVPSGLPLAD